MKNSPLFFLLMAILGFPCFALSQERYLSDQIKILKQYDREHLHRLALPMGGIGTGTVALGGAGELRDWEIMNVPAKNYSTVTTGNDAPFFFIYTKKMDLP